MRDIEIMAYAAQSTIGVFEIIGGGTGAGLRRHALEKRMKRLCDHGYFAPYVHGGWEITEKGREFYQTMKETP